MIERDVSDRSLDGGSYEPASLRSAHRFLHSLAIVRNPVSNWIRQWTLMNHLSANVVNRSEQGDVNDFTYNDRNHLTPDPMRNVQVENTTCTSYCLTQYMYPESSASTITTRFLY